MRFDVGPSHKVGDFGGGVLAGFGDAAAGAGADGEPVGAWGVHPDQGDGGCGRAGVEWRLESLCDARTSKGVWYGNRG